MSCVATFETAIGWAGIAWNRRGITGVELPQSSAARTVARLVRHHPGARAAPPPAAVDETVSRIGALLRGEPSDLAAVELDLAHAPALDLEVYQAVRTIPFGETRSYAAVARELPRTTPREVAAALARNPVPLIIPCHRVVASDGGLGGFSAPGGVATKRRLLAIEGASIRGQLPLFH